MSKMNYSTHWLPCNATSQLYRKHLVHLTAYLAGSSFLGPGWVSAVEELRSWLPRVSLHNKLSSTERCRNLTRRTLNLLWHAFAYLA